MERLNFFVSQHNIQKSFVKATELWSYFFSFFLLHLQFNFVGKILGPQGNTIKRLQEETGAKISVLGKGSMRDKAKVRESPLERYVYVNAFHVAVRSSGSQSIL